MTPERRANRAIIAFSPTRYCDSHDNARPDAPPQELAQVEPGHCGRLVCPPLHPQLPARRRAGRGQQLRRRRRRRTRHHRRASSAASTSSRWQAYRQSYGANVDEQAAQAARHRPAHRPADDPGRGVAGRSRPSRDQGERRRGPRADPVAAGVPGERPVHRRPALPAAAARCRTRRCAPTSSRTRSAAASSPRSCRRR